eukprot:13397557-Alexandrium_andersonii.AAC.1
MNGPRMPGLTKCCREALQSPRASSGTKLSAAAAGWPASRCSTAMRRPSNSLNQRSDSLVGAPVTKQHLGVPSGLREKPTHADDPEGRSAWCRSHRRSARVTSSSRGESSTHSRVPRTPVRSSRSALSVMSQANWPPTAVCSESGWTHITMRCPKSPSLGWENKEIPRPPSRMSAPPDAVRS